MKCTANVAMTKPPMVIARHDQRPRPCLADRSRQIGPPGDTGQDER